MDFKQIQELIKIINKSNIGELSIEDKDFKIIIKQKEEPQVQTIVSATSPPVPAVGSSSQTTVPNPAPSVPASMGTSLETSPSSVKQDSLITIKSPMIGTFYRRPSPDKPIFVEIGDDVAPGKVVCIIEAMKLFNEIESEVSGRIVKALVEDASPVEYDQPLFLVDPL
jgi:acetyl-CoA carboxylase biotin carboxyl carrier protein